MTTEHGRTVTSAIERRMGERATPVLGVINEVFGAYPAMPFGLRLDEFVDYAIRQFDGRMAGIERARITRRADVDLDEAGEDA